MQTCGKCRTQSPDMAANCRKCGADLSKESETARARAQMQANPRVSLVRVAVAQDACPACKAAQGTHDKHAAPPLPIEGCSGALGCRCHYDPVLTEIYP